MSMKGRSWQSEKYRYGFNGKENDSDWEVQDYGFRIYKPELGKFLSVDPLTSKYPFYTPYQFAGNTPIKFIDLDGLEPAEPEKTKGLQKTLPKIQTSECTKFNFYIAKANRKQQDGATDWALELVYREAMDESVFFLNKTFVVLEVSNTQDMWLKLSAYVNQGHSIGDIIIDSHGDYLTSPKFEIGESKFTNKNFQTKTTYLEKLSQMLSTDTDVCFLACHLGNFELKKGDGAKLMSKVAKTLKVDVYGSQSWTGYIPGMFSGNSMITPSAITTTSLEDIRKRPLAVENLGKWTVALGGTGTLAETNPVYFGSDGKINVQKDNSTNESSVIKYIKKFINYIIKK